MPEEGLVQFCAPTLAGMKTGSLFACPFSDAEQLRDFLRVCNRSLGGKGVCVLSLRYENGRALIYVYRPRLLVRDLQNEEARRLLAERGYDAARPACCLAQLVRRFHGAGAFPHEVGLFLGYPPEDVRGFIEGRQTCKCAGCWKVYGDAQAATRLFRKYKKCTDVYRAQFSQGKSIERLAVAG